MILVTHRLCRTLEKHPSAIKAEIEQIRATTRKLQGVDVLLDICIDVEELLRLCTLAAKGAGK